MIVVMSREQFQIAYDGGALRGHAMDVQTLAPALLAVGDLIREVNDELNRGRTKVNVLVKADFEHKCFNVNLELVQSLYDSVRDLLSQQEVKDAKELLEWIGLIGTTVSVPLLLFLRIQNGRRKKSVKKVEDPSEKGNVVVQFEGDDSPVVVNQTIIDLSENPQIRESVEGLFEPLEREGIDGFQTRENDKVVESFHEEDGEKIRRSCQIDYDDEEAERFEPQDIRTHLTVYGPIFDIEAEKWRFLYGGKSIYADITSTQIAHDAIERGGVEVDESYEVILEITEYKTPKGQYRHRYRIKEVLNYFPAPPEPPKLI